MPFMSNFDELIVAMREALKLFEAQLERDGQEPDEWDYDDESLAWSRDLLFTLDEVDETLDLRCTLQVTSVDLGEGRELPILAISFLVLDGIDSPLDRMQPLHRALASLNTDQLCVKWTPVFSPDDGQVTGLWATTENFIQSISAEFLSVTYEALLNAVSEAYPKLVAVTERMQTA